MKLWILMSYVITCVVSAAVIEVAANPAVRLSKAVARSTSEETNNQHTNKNRNGSEKEHKTLGKNIVDRTQLKNDQFRGILDDRYNTKFPRQPVLAARFNPGFQENLLDPATSVIGINTETSPNIETPEKINSNPVMKANGPENILEGGLQFIDNILTGGAWSKGEVEEKIHGQIKNDEENYGTGAQNNGDILGQAKKSGGGESDTVAGAQYSNFDVQSKLQNREENYGGEIVYKNGQGDAKVREHGVGYGWDAINRDSSGKLTTPSWVFNNEENSKQNNAGSWEKQNEVISGQDKGRCQVNNEGSWNKHDIGGAKQQNNRDNGECQLQSDEVNKQNSQNENLQDYEGNIGSYEGQKIESGCQMQNNRVNWEQSNRFDRGKNNGFYWLPYNGVSWGLNQGFNWGRNNGFNWGFNNGGNWGLSNTFYPRIYFSGNWGQNNGFYPVLYVGGNWGLNNGLYWGYKNNVNWANNRGFNWGQNNGFDWTQNNGVNWGQKNGFDWRNWFQDKNFDWKHGNGQNTGCSCQTQNSGGTWAEQNNINVSGKDNVSGWGVHNIGGKDSQDSTREQNKNVIWNDQGKSYGNVWGGEQVSKEGKSHVVGWKVYKLSDGKWRAQDTDSNSWQTNGLANVGGSASVGGLTGIGGSLGVGGSAHIRGSLGVGGSLGLSPVGIGGLTSIGGSAGVGGNTNFGGSLSKSLSIGGSTNTGSLASLSYGTAVKNMYDGLGPYKVV